MKEEKTKSKKKWLYYVVLAVSVLLIATAIVLTVYFVTNSTNPVLDNPPIDTGKNPEDPGKPDDPTPPDTPSDGTDTVKFVSPIEGAAYTVEYNVIYKNETLGWIYRHKAVDFNAEEGTQVCCMADGTVKEISYSEETGNLIIVDHGDGLLTIYRFVEPNASLKEGATVKKGEALGKVAAAYGIEHHDGTHLHLEIELNGDAVDPTLYLDPVLEEK